VVSNVAEPLTQGKPAPALALARPGEPGVPLGAQGRADRRRDRHQFLRDLVEGVAQAVAEACTREQRPPTADRAVEAIGQDASDPIRRRLLDRCPLQLPIGLHKGCGTGLRGVAQIVLSTIMWQKMP